MSLEYSDVEIYAGSDGMVHAECSLCGWTVPVRGYPITVDQILEEFDGHEAQGCYYK